MVCPKAKILLQRLWEQKIDWDDSVPQPIHDVCSQWRSELNLLTERDIPRCYFPKTSHIVSSQLHGFSDASELAYAGVVYLRQADSDGNIHISLVTSKTKVAPLKRLTIPRLELAAHNYWPNFSATSRKYSVFLPTMDRQHNSSKLADWKPPSL